MRSLGGTYNSASQQSCPSTVPFCFRSRKAAGRVRKTGMPVELEPMSSAERRVIHMELAEDPTVMSESSGEGKNRRVVVKPS